MNLPSEKLVNHEIEYDLDFEQLYKENYRQTYYFFLRRAGEFFAEDLTQDFFLRVYRGIGAFRGESSLKTWLYEIRDNILKNHYRNRGTQKRQAWEISFEEACNPEGEIYFFKNEEVALHSAHSFPSPLDQLSQNEELANIQNEVRRALRNFPPQMKKCFRLRVQGFKYREIADTLHIGIQTVKAHIYQAKRKMRELLPGEQFLQALEHLNILEIFKDQNDEILKFKQKREPRDNVPQVTKGVSLRERKNTEPANENEDKDFSGEFEEERNSEYELGSIQNISTSHPVKLENFREEIRVFTQQVDTITSITRIQIPLSFLTPKAKSSKVLSYNKKGILAYITWPKEGVSNIFFDLETGLSMEFPTAISNVRERVKRATLALKTRDIISQRLEEQLLSQV